MKNHLLEDTVHVYIDGGGRYEEGRIRRGDNRLMQAFSQWQIDNSIFPIKGYGFSDGSQGKSGAFFPNEYRSAIEKFFEDFYRDNPDFPENTVLDSRIDDELGLLK